MHETFIFTAECRKQKTRLCEKFSAIAEPVPDWSAAEANIPNRWQCSSLLNYHNLLSSIYRYTFMRNSLARGQHHVIILMSPLSVFF